MASALRTPICREPEIEYPVLSVGFGFCAGPELVSSVSGAGGCGVLGGGGIPPDEIGRRIARVREGTDRPTGVNLMIADFEDPDAPDEDLDLLRDQAGAAIERGAAMLACKARRSSP